MRKAPRFNHKLSKKSTLQMAVNRTYIAMRSCLTSVQRLLIAFTTIISLIIIWLGGFSAMGIIKVFASIMITICGFLIILGVVCYIIWLELGSISSLLSHLMRLNII